MPGPVTWTGPTGNNQTGDTFWSILTPRSTPRGRVQSTISTTRWRSEPAFWARQSLIPWPLGGLTIQNLCTPGWVPTNTAVAEAVASVKVKVGGSYHLPREVTVADEVALKRTVEVVVEVMKAAGLQPKIIIPRYLNAPCCSSKDHSVNRGARRRN